MPEAIIALILSFTAVVLSLIAIRRQRLPTKYEIQRRIKGTLEKRSPDFTVLVNGIEYRIIAIEVKPKEGWKNRIWEYAYGEIQAETTIEILTNIRTEGRTYSVYTSGEGIFGLDDIEPGNWGSRGGGLRLQIELETTEAGEVVNQVWDKLHVEIPTYLHHSDDLTTKGSAVEPRNREDPYIKDKF